MNKIPRDLEKVLTGDARVVWNTLTSIGQRDFVRWIDSAKQTETRNKRIDSVPSRLQSGKRRPCCYATVPMELYKALTMFPKAKETWKSLTPHERRDFSDWIDESKNTNVRMERITETCRKLALGKRKV